MLQSLYRRLPIIRELRELARLQEKMLVWVEVNHKRESQRFEDQLLESSRYSDPKNLCRYEHKLYSQFGEDGIIHEIFQRIGTTTCSFLEVGVGDGLENNTTALLLEGWTGAWLEGDPLFVENIRRGMRTFLERGALQLTQAFVTSENINSLISRLELPFEIDLLSLDVDQNTYWI